MVNCGLEKIFLKSLHAPVISPIFYFDLANDGQICHIHYTYCVCYKEKALQLFFLTVFVFPFNYLQTFCVSITHRTFTIMNHVRPIFCVCSRTAVDVLLFVTHSIFTIMNHQRISTFSFCPPVSLRYTHAVSTCTRILKYQV